MKLTLPLTVTLPRKTKKDKVVSLSLNWYRNAQFFENNAVKAKYKELVGWALVSAGTAARMDPPVAFSYRYFFKRKSDVGNFHAVVEKFFLDALVEMGLLPEDNCEVVTGGEYEFAGYDKTNPRVEIEVIHEQTAP